MSLPRIAAIQMVSGDHVDANLEAAERLVLEAADQGADLVVLPETFAMFDSKQQQLLGRTEASDRACVRPFIQALAHRLNIWIVAGTIPLAPSSDSDRVYASCFVVDNQGIEVTRYDKIHLFDVDVGDQQGVYRESDTFCPGSQAVVIDTPFGRLGLAVCYDIRFPEFFRAMFAERVDLIAVPAAFTYTTGKAHWLALLRARAIENQCYIVGANQGGEHTPSRSTSGGSVIVDGWGNVLSELNMGEGIAMAEMDLAALKAQRKAMPIAAHQRFYVNDKPR